MSILEVRRVDGVFGIVAGDGAWRPVRTGGEPVRQFNAGWSPVCAIDAFAPLHMLSLRQEGGAEATWILDGEMGRLGDAVGQVPDRDRHALRERADALLGLVFGRILAAPRPEAAGGADDLAALCEATITEPVGLVASDRAAGIVVVDLNDPVADAALEPFGLAAAALRLTLDGPLPETFRQRMRLVPKYCRVGLSHRKWRCKSRLSGARLETRRYAVGRNNARSCEELARGLCGPSDRSRCNRTS